MIATETEIQEFIPQREPFVMIHRLVYSDNQKTITELTVANDNIFCINGKFSESGIVENIAQTAAAGVGYLCRQEQREVPVGYIAAIKDLKIYEQPNEGDVLSTEAVILQTVLQVSLVQGQVHVNGRLIATCEMRIFVRPDTNA
jgi:3-hydroxyacyl-[acyl-carrier-protein] dehydratase